MLAVPCCILEYSSEFTPSHAMFVQEIGWHYWGNTEAVPVGRKRHRFALFLNYIIAQSFNICQIYKKCYRTRMRKFDRKPMSICMAFMDCSPSRNKLHNKNQYTQ